MVYNHKAILDLDIIINEMFAILSYPIHLNNYHIHKSNFKH